MPQRGKKGDTQSGGDGEFIHVPIILLGLS